MNPFTEHAVVLNTTPLRESDLIATLLTERHGKLSAVARGARKSKRRFMGGCDVFDCGIFEITAGRGRSGLYNILGIRERQAWLALRSNLRKYSIASFVLEIANNFLPEGDADNGKLTVPLMLTLKTINDAEEETTSWHAATQFSLMLLNVSGFHPLEDDIVIKPEIRQWWQQLVAGHDTAPPSDAHAQESFYILMRYIENILGRELKTHKAVVNQKET